MNGWFAPVLQHVPPLHFQRPWWLWALLALPLLWWLWRRRRQRGWRDAVDPHLLPHLLEPGSGRAWWRLVGVSAAFALAVVAMAGPGWQKQATPLWQSRAPLVVAIDLSSTILAPDLAPSRLAQARAKIATLLRMRQAGEVGLVAWADDAYTVAPLTTDSRNIALFLEALSPEIMPVDGQRADRAITHAASLLQQAGFDHGQILLVTGQADAAAPPVAAAVAAQGYRTSVLGLGTASGAVHRDRSGALRHARLDEASLRALAAAGGGGYAALRVDESDLKSLGVLDPGEADAGRAGAGEAAWLDQGYWLLVPLLVLAALAFRRGVGVLAALVLALALPPAAQAADGWWRRADQQAQQRLERGVDAYRQGDYAAAEEAFAGAGARGAEAQYNLGNALARQGRYDAAIAAYDRALAQAPGMEDAIANRRVVDAARKRQPPQGGQGQQQSGQPAAGDGQQSPADSGASSAADGNSSSQAPPDANARGRAPPPQPPPQAQDAQARQRQAQADLEQQRRMQQALQQGPGTAPSPAGQAVAENAQAREQRQAREAWLRRVPDDPGGLLRAKFQLEHERRQQEGR